MYNPTVIHIVGARPQFIKLSPVVEAFKRLGLPYKVVHTGQHYDYTMSDLHFTSLGMEAPHYDLGIGSDSHGRQTAKMLQGIEDVLVKENPKMVLRLSWKRPLLPSPAMGIRSPGRN